MKPTSDHRPWMEAALTKASAGELEGDAAGSSRRDFLGLLGLGAAASLAACSRRPVQEAIPLLIPAEEVTPGVPALYASTCLACPAACGLIATVRDGRPVKLEGDAKHPLSQGGLCAVGQGELRGLYDPGRLSGPTIEGRAVTWDELDRHVMSKLAGLAASGQRLVVLTPTLVSPSGRRAAGLFLQRFGGELVEHDAGVAAPEAPGQAYASLDGGFHLPAYDLAAADLWLSLSSDLLGTGSEPVAHTAGWAARRRAAAERGLPRHIQVEGSLSLTGANADERWQATAAERRSLALWLLRDIAAAGSGDEQRAVAAALAELPPAAGLQERVPRLADELRRAGAGALITSGSDDAAEQIAVALLNRFLGSEGTTLDLHRPSRVRRGQPAALRRLLDDLDAGRVGALIVVNTDPVNQLPGGDAFAAAYSALPLALAIDDRPTATTAAAGVVAPAHHSLERWADCEPRQGLRTLAQPSIVPLFHTREPFLGFLRWAGEPAAEWRAFLKEEWMAAASAGAIPVPGGKEMLWQRTVQSAGLETAGSFAFARGVAGSAVVGQVPAAAVMRAALDSGDSSSGDAGPAAAAGSVEIDLIAEVGLRDGRHSHIPWLRELPDPLTRAAWTACARLAPSRAREMGVSDGDLVRIGSDGASVMMPVRLLPGQHPDVIAVPVGYGVSGDDSPEWNAWRLQRWGSHGLRRSGLAGSVATAGGRMKLPLMQIEASTHGRPLLHQLTGPDEKVHGPHHPEATLWPQRPDSSPHWEMVINLDACTGCSACVIACQAENNIPVVGPESIQRHRDMHWLRIDRYYQGSEEAPDVLFEPMLCAQCDNAPCETVCPVAATVHSEDGLNQQVYNRCVGTRYCANNCPYKVRRFNWFDFTPKDPMERMVLNPEVVVRTRGVMEKCTFCVQRIQAARIESRQNGEEQFSVATACQQSCPARAIEFGDATLADGPIARLKRQGNAFQALAEIGVAPSITYLARRRNRAPGGQPAAGGHGHGAGEHGEDA